MSDLYESGMAKVKQAEKISDIDSSDNENNKQNRQNRAKKIHSDDEYDDDSCCMLPPAPKKPTSFCINKSSEYSLQSPNGEYSKFSNKASYQQKENRNPADLLSSSPFNAKQKVASIKSRTLNVNNSTILENEELKKELLRRCNQIDAKLNSIDERLKTLEEKLESGINNKRDEYFNIEDTVTLPLNTIDDMTNLESDLQDTDFFNKIVNL